MFWTSWNLSRTSSQSISCFIFGGFLFHLFMFLLFTPTISHPKKHNDEKCVTKTVHSLEDWKAAAFACLYGAWLCTTKSYLEDGLPFSKWLITMVSKSPRLGVIPLPNGLFMAYKIGVTNHLLNGMILQVGKLYPTWEDRLPGLNGSVLNNHEVIVGCRPPVRGSGC